jgi:hypothetical protein
LPHERLRCIKNEIRAAMTPLPGAYLVASEVFSNEVEMRNMKWLLAAGLIAATTAACTDPYGGYPNTAYNSGYSNGYYNTGYYRNGAPAPVYSSNTGYYRNAAPAPVYNSGYAYNSTPRRGPNGDYDHDGIPNKYDRDANGDGVPDRFQR